MDRMSGGNNEGFANDHVFANSQHQYNSYDNLNLFPNGTPSNFNDASWGIHAGDFPNPVTSRAQDQPLPSWQQNANHLSATSAHAGYGGQSSPYGRALNQSPAPYGSNAFNHFGTQQGYPYRQTQQQYDPSLVAQPGNSQNYNLGVHGFHSSAPNGGTITPQALQNKSAHFSGNQYAGNAVHPNYSQALPKRPVSTASQARPVDPRVLAASIPKGANSGMFSIISFDDLSRATNSERMGNYVNVGKEAHEWDCSRSAIPAYVPRKSRNELRALAGNNPAALAKLGKKSIKNKNRPMLLSDVKSAESIASPSRIKYEGDSSSSEDSSSDDDSEYSDEDDSDSPLPSKRPDSPKGAVEYDTIKALWRSKRKALDSETIRKSLVDFWELVKTIRDRWKADTAAVTDAEEKKRVGELPLLQSRVKDQRDMMEAAFKAALKHGRRGIVELLGENVSLVFVCYQFLLDRFKADDHNGSLARTILETMSTFTTLTKDKIEKTHLVKVLPRYQKKGDAKTQWWLKRINENAEAATKEAATKAEQKKGAKSGSASADAKPASPPARKVAETSAGVKRAAPSTLDGAAQKKVATSAGKTNGVASTTKSNGVVKKPTPSGDNMKPSGSAPVAARKTVVAKPSGFFSSLNSASKKPGTSNSDKSGTTAAKPAASKPMGATASAPKPTFSFAETMANLSKPKEEKPAPKPQKDLPEETPEEREKRLRKEKRRKLHVQFKPLEDLVEIRYFTHDPQEEIDHDSSQMRDVSDVGGEGRMFKQQAHRMDIDDEDEAAEEAEDLRDHRPPSLVDFSVVDKEERKRNYAPYGGGEMAVESAERPIRDAYESANLMVFYADSSQIPPDPREPGDPSNGETGGAIKYFGAPEEKYAVRARNKLGERMAAQRTNQQHAPTAAISSVPDISAILANLAQTSAVTQAGYPQQQQQQPAPAMNSSYNHYQHQQSATPAQPPGGLDLGAILAQLNQQAGQNAPNTAPMMSFGQQPQQVFQGHNPHGGAASDSNRAKLPYKTRVCSFWQRGTCGKGDACTFLHE